MLWTKVDDLLDNMAMNIFLFQPISYITLCVESCDYEVKREMMICTFPESGHKLKYQERRK
jgi:hypothetical protein